MAAKVYLPSDWASEFLFQANWFKINSCKTKGSGCVIMC